MVKKEERQKAYVWQRKPPVAAVNMHEQHI
jgi:hypothetical protein